MILDPGANRDIETLIRQVAGSGFKVIRVTHDLGAVQRIGEDILFMRKGQVLEITPVDGSWKPGLE